MKYEGSKLGELASKPFILHDFPLIAGSIFLYEKCVRHQSTERNKERLLFSLCMVQYILSFK